MKIVTQSEMKKIDNEAINKLGIPSLLLMERAGKKVAEEALKILKEAEQKSVIIFAGTGNNGGDGFVAGRYLLLNDIQVKIVIINSPGKGDAKMNLDFLKNLGVSPIVFADGKKSKRELSSCGLIIDAILGTGTKGKLRHPLPDIIKLINRADRPVISVDIPTGLCADTGEIFGSCINAAQTVTMALPKLGQMLFPGADYTGKLTVADIGIPQTLTNSDTLKVTLPERGFVHSRMPRRTSNSHKGNFGHILIIAGSPGYTGAAALTSRGALRAGAGLVTLGIPKSLNRIMEAKLTEVITRPLPETKDAALHTDAMGHILKLLDKTDVLALGPGLGIHTETASLIRKLIPKVKKPIVIDADGLNALRGDISILKVLRNCVITPHPGELSRLLKKPISEIQSDRVGIARKTARELKITVVLKGARTVIASPDGYVFINPTGNSGMATAGSGDVLTGMLASLIGQGLSPADASVVSVYIHGLAGDIAAKEKGEACLLASDIVEYLPKAMMEISVHGSQFSVHG